MDYENRKMKQCPKPKWFQDLITLVISFAMVVGIFGGMKLDVEANEHSLKLSDLANNEGKTNFMNDTFTSGDTIKIDANGTTYTSAMCYFYIEYGGEKLPDEHLMFMQSKNYVSTLTIPSKETTTMQWQCTSINDSETQTIYFTYVFKNSSSDPSDTPSSETGSESASSTPSDTSSSQTGSEAVPSHQCNFQWVTTVEPQPNADGLEEYMCTGCGAVQEQRSIPASMASVKNLFGFVNNVPKNGTVTTDFGKLHTISDYLLNKMAERNDATVTIQFEYKNQKLQITFPAGTDYTPVLTDTDTMYGFYGVAARLGLTVTERQ